MPSARAVAADVGMVSPSVDVVPLRNRLFQYGSAQQESSACLVYLDILMQRRARHFFPIVLTASLLQLHRQRRISLKLNRLRFPG